MWSKVGTGGGRFKQMWNKYLPSNCKDLEGKCGVYWFSVYISLFLPYSQGIDYKHLSYACLQKQREM